MTGKTPRVRRMRHAATCWVALMAAAGAAPAATVTVCPSGCDSATIQGAAVVADPGDTIQLLSSQAHTEGDIFLTKNLTIAGFGVDTTVIQAGSSSGSAVVPVLVVAAGARVTIQDLTIQYGGGSNGGGVRIQDGRVILTDVSVKDNRVTACGGGVYVAAGSTLEIGGGSFFRNSADDGGGVCNLGTADIRGTNFFDNRAVATGIETDNSGGAIHNSGALELHSVVLAQNWAGAGNDHGEAIGGGLSHSGSSLLIEDSRISNNDAIGDWYEQGGGLYLGGTGTATLRRTSVTFNSAADGGGIAVRSGSLFLESCSVANNFADLGGGLGLWHSSPAAVEVAHCTLSRNRAERGGGVYTSGDGTTRVWNSTVSGNDADGDGGGFYVSAPGMEIASSTIADNTADADADNQGDGGGMLIEATTTVGMRNTIVAENHDGSSVPNPIARDCVGKIQSAGYLLIGNMGSPLPTCGILGETTGNLLGIDPMMFALADNGGPTMTHWLDGGSLAIDSGNPSGCTDPTGTVLDTDQRHWVRRDRCDIGAIEVSAVMPGIFADGFESGDFSAWSAVASRVSE